MKTAYKRKRYIIISMITTT